MARYQHPCNLCKKQNCNVGDEDCIFYLRFNRQYECAAWDCIVNYEGTCLLELYDACGCCQKHNVQKK